MVKVSLCENSKMTKKDFAKSLRTAYSCFTQYFGNEYADQIKSNLSEAIYLVVEKIKPDKRFADEIKELFLKFNPDSFKNKVVCNAIDKFIIGKKQFINIPDLTASFYKEKYKDTYPNIENFSSNDFKSLYNVFALDKTQTEEFAAILQKLTGKTLTAKEFKKDNKLMTSLENSVNECEEIINSFKNVSRIVCDTRFNTDYIPAIKLLQNSFSDELYRMKIINQLKTYCTNGYNASKIAQACFAPDSSLFKSTFFARPVVFLPNECPNFVIIHELTHIVSMSNRADFNNLKIGIIDPEFESSDALNEVLTEYFEMEISSKMTIDDNLIGTGTVLPSVYQTAFPFIQNLLEKYKTDFKTAFMNKQPGLLFEKFGKKNIVLLNQALIKLFGLHLDDLTEIDNMKKQILAELSEEQLKKIDNRDKYANGIIFAEIEKNIDEFVNSTKNQENLEYEKEDL